MRTLLPKTWLNDDVINSFFILLLAREKSSKVAGSPKCHFMKTHFYTKLAMQPKGQVEDVRYDASRGSRWAQVPADSRAIRGRAGRGMADPARVQRESRRVAQSRMSSARMQVRLKRYAMTPREEADGRKFPPTAGPSEAGRVVGWQIQPESHESRAESRRVTQSRVCKLLRQSRISMLPQMSASNASTLTVGVFSLRFVAARVIGAAVLC